MGMVISQVEEGALWDMDNARLSKDIRRRCTRPRAQTHSAHIHEDDHIWYTDDILCLLWQHRLIFLLWHPLACGCYSSQIYHSNGEVVTPEDYLRDKYIFVSLDLDRMSQCWLFSEECLKDGSKLSLQWVGHDKTFSKQQQWALTTSTHICWTSLT